MAKTATPPAEDTPSTTRLSLVLPPLASPADVPSRLAEALGGADIAAVMASFATKDPRAVTAITRALADAVQPSGAALLVTADPGLAARGGADGVHLPYDETALREAIERSKDRIVGAGQLRSKDEAMTAGELGCDYVMFGEAYDRRGEIFVPPFELVCERAEWWATIFEIPVVVLARSLDEVAELAKTGADFIALDLASFGPAQPLGALISEANALLARRPA